MNEALQLQPSTILRKQHAKSVTCVRMYGDEILTAGADGRICRYHWHPLSDQQQKEQQLLQEHHRQRRQQQQQEHQSMQSMPVQQHQQQDKQQHQPESQLKQLGYDRRQQQQQQHKSQLETAGVSKRDLQPVVSESATGGAVVKASQDDGHAGGAEHTGHIDHSGHTGGAEHAGPAGHAGLKCTAEERFADISLVQDVIRDPQTKQTLVCGFKVKPHNMCQKALEGSPCLSDLPLYCQRKGVTSSDQWNKLQCS